MKKNNSNPQLKIDFEAPKNNVKVISINRAQNLDLNAKILNRKRTNI